MDLMALSSSPRAVLDVIAGRVWPAAWRHGWREAPAYFVHRAVRWIYRRLVFERPSSTETGALENEVISLADRDSEERLLGALRRGPVWVAPADGAMEPAIPLFGRARIVPIASGTLRLSGVVVARGATGRCMLQRVIGLAGDMVRLKSDTELGDERTLPASALLGSCDLVDVDGRRVPVVERPHGSLGILRAIVHSQLKTRAATRVL
jgi:hypothetical protein